VDILLLTSEFAPAMGGIGTYAGEIAAAAARLGARVNLVAPDYGQDNAGRDHALPFKVVRFRGGLHSMKDLPAKMMLARNNVREHPYDVIHAADWPFFIPVALTRRQTPARLLMTVHGTEINETQTPLKRLAIRSAGVFGPRTEIIANSRYTRDLFCERFSVDAGQISAVNLGVSDFWFGERRDRADIRAGLGLAPERLVMVTVARITHRKGHHLTVAALARLPERLRQRITWLVIGPNGESDYVNEFRRLIETANCDIRLLGPLPNEEIRDIYGAADLFCLTGLTDSNGRVEGFGLVYLEAGAGGVPSVATAVGGVADAVLPDQSGILVPPDIDRISSSIARFAENDELRATLAAGALAHARALSWERCAAATYGLAAKERPAPQAEVVTA
jgi:phosphatidylinositol alpha-1,6-mannosyltransferase